jgi:hypothetical protein
MPAPSIPTLTAYAIGAGYDIALFAYNFPAGVYARDLGGVVYDGVHDNVYVTAPANEFPRPGFRRQWIVPGTPMGGIPADANAVGSYYDNLSPVAQPGGGTLFITEIVDSSEIGGVVKGFALSGNNADWLGTFSSGGVFAPTVVISGTGFTIKARDAVFHPSNGKAYVTYQVGSAYALAEIDTTTATARVLSSNVGTGRYLSFSQGYSSLWIAGGSHLRRHSIVDGSILEDITLAAPLASAIIGRIGEGVGTLAGKLLVATSPSSTNLYELNRSNAASNALLNPITGGAVNSNGFTSFKTGKLLFATQASDSNPALLQLTLPNCAGVYVGGTSVEGLLYNCTPSAPNAPVLLGPSDCEGCQLTLVWNAVDDAIGYHLYRLRGPHQVEPYEEDLIYTGPATMFTDTDVLIGTPYYYTVIAYSLDGDDELLSPTSNNVTATPCCGPCESAEEAPGACGWSSVCDC